MNLQVKKVIVHIEKNSFSSSEKSYKSLSSKENREKSSLYYKKDRHIIKFLE